MVAGAHPYKEHCAICHGMRLSGMPGFAGILSNEQRWQLAMLVAHADKLPPAVT